MTIASAYPGIVGGAAKPPWLTHLFTRLDHRQIPDLIDGAIAIGCFAAFTVPVLVGWASGRGTSLEVTSFGVLTAAPLIVRRKWPVTVLVFIVLGYLAATVFGVQFTPFISNAGPAFAVAVFTVADRCDRQRSALVVLLAASVASFGQVGLSFQFHPHQAQDAWLAIEAALSWIAGDLVRTRRTYRHELEQQRSREATERERRLLAEERLSLSRELHDVLSHSLSLIAVRSGVARLLLEEQPAEAKAALATIETASRSALNELRGLLRQIREPATGGEPLAPTLADLPALVGRLAGDGLHLDYRSTGQPFAYQTELQLSGYRIAQEALTNVVKHAQAEHAWLEISHGESELTIRVTDDGAGRSPEPAGTGYGLGLTGMAERAGLLGGTLAAGPRPGGGFEVLARLPVTRPGL